MKLPPPVLPNWHPRSELSRPTAQALRRVENRKSTLTYAGPNAVIPVVYGEQLVGGPIIAGPVVWNTSVYYAVALCWAGSEGVHRIEDVRLGDNIRTLAQITNPNAGVPSGSVGNVVAQVYDGRQTSADSQLISAIPGFDDSFHGIAYARLQLAVSGNFTNLPQVTFRVKGRRCFDPRDNTTAWTENPALHMHDFVTDTEIGMGVGMIGTAQAADICDSLYSGIPRSRTGLCIQDPMTEEDALSLFAQYAEVLWSYDGRDVTVIPDAPVQTIHSIDAGDMREGSLQLSTVGLEQIPTQVRIQFSDRDEPEWPSRPAVAQVPEHTMHGLPMSPSSVPLPGVFNRLEADRRAAQRLRRLQTPGRVEWQMFSPGMPYQAGDVVKLPSRRGLQSVDVRITAQPEMVGPMLYQMGGEIYRESSYPTGAQGIAVPQGAILILRGSGAVPSGWSLVDTGGRLIREGAPGNAGTLSSVSFSFPTGQAGEHLGTRSTQNLALLNSPPPGTDPLQVGTPIVYVNAGGVTPSPSQMHTHSFSGSIPVRNAVSRTDVRFVRRTGNPSLLSAGLAFFGYTNLSSEYAVEATGLSGGYLTGGTSEARRSATTRVTSTTSTRADHTHNAYMCQPRYNPGSGFVNSVMGQPAGEHNHSASVSISAQLRSIALAVFESLGDAALPEGAIVGWDGGTPPSGWALCDGSNGTIDLRERFIYITALEQAGVEHEDVSEITITASGSTSSGGAHTHRRAFGLRTPDGSITGANYNPFHTDSAGAHAHSVSGNKTDSLDNVQRYQLRFIQYIGE